MYPYIITQNSITFVVDSVVRTILKEDANYESLKEAIRQKDWEAAKTLATPRKEAILSWLGGAMVLENNVFIREGKPVDNAVVPHILSLLEQGFDVEPLIHFLDSLLSNPSKRSRDQVWRFVSTNNVTIDQDGALLFYKSVADDHWDMHTRKTHQYKPGAIVSMDRGEVDDDPNSTCSVGLHVCSYEYLRHFPGKHTMLVKVYAEDIVSVPVDYENTKVRVSRLQVLREVDPHPTTKTTYA